MPHSGPGGQYFSAGSSIHIRGQKPGARFRLRRYASSAQAGNGLVPGPPIAGGRHLRHP